MISGIAKKLIFTYFLFVNFAQSSTSADIQKVNNIKNNGATQVNWSNTTFKDFQEILVYKKHLDKYSEPLIAGISNNQGEIVIQSDQQSELNGVIYAEGNVVVEYKGKILRLII